MDFFDDYKFPQGETIMRFMMMYKPEHERPATKEHMAQMGEFIAEEMKSGALLSTGGLLPPSKGARVRLSAGKVTVTDGPFAEAKEVVGGYAIVRADSKE